MRTALIACALLAAAPAFAEGFVTRDLTTVAIDTTSLSPGEWIRRVEPDRVTLMCLGCAQAPMIDILIGRQDDGTEQRIRSGETTMETMRALCQAGQPDCTLEALDAGAAIGWITGWPMGSQRGNTAVILRDGDLLTIRSLSTDEGLSHANAAAIIAIVVPQVVGD